MGGEQSRERERESNARGVNVEKCLSGSSSEESSDESEYSWATINSR